MAFTVPWLLCASERGFVAAARGKAPSWKISLTPFWAGSDLCSILRCWLSGGLCVHERLYVTNLLQALEKNQSLHCLISCAIRGGLSPYGFDAPVVLQSSFPPQGLCRFLTSHWKRLASPCLSALADQGGHISDLFWVSVCLCHLLPGWAGWFLCILLPCLCCLHTWLLCHTALFRGEGPNPPFLNGRICYQFLRKGRNFSLCVKTQSSSCVSDRVKIFQNPATIELWRFCFWIKPFK